MADEPQENQQPSVPVHPDEEVQVIEEALKRFIDDHPEVRSARDANNPNLTTLRQVLYDRLNPAVWDQFVSAKPDKAAQLAETYVPIQQALERQQAQAQQAQSVPTRPLSGSAAQSSFGEFDRRAKQIQQGEQLAPLGPSPSQAKPGSFSAFDRRTKEVQAGAREKQNAAWEAQVVAAQAQTVLQTAADIEAAKRNRQPQTTASRTGPRTILKGPTTAQRIAGKGLKSFGYALAGAQVAGGLGDNPNMSQPVYRTYYSQQEFSVLRRELPGLRQGTAEWSRLTSQFPELQAVRDGREFEEWRREHPEIPSSAWNSHDAAMKYAQYFPDGFESEREFQNQVMDHEKRQKEQAQQEEARHKAEKREMWQHMTHLPHTPIINRFFLADRIDQDRDFKKVVERLRAEHDAKNPGDRIQGKTFTRAKDGTMLIAENVLAAVPDIQQRAHEVFTKEKPKIALRYKKTKRDILTDHSRYNPELQTIHAKARSLAEHEFRVKEAVYQRSRHLNPRMVGPDINELEAKFLEPMLEAFIRKSPRNAALARAYQEHDPYLKGAIARVDNEAVLQRLTTQFHADPEIQTVLKDIDQQVQAGVAAERQRKARDLNYQERSETEIRAGIESRVFRTYFAKNPDKANEYATIMASVHPGMTKAYAAWLQEQQVAGVTPEKQRQQAQAARTGAPTQAARSAREGPTVTPGLHRLSASSIPRQAPGGSAPSQATRFTPSSFAQGMGGRVGNEPSPATTRGRLPSRRGRVRAPLRGVNPISPVGRLAGGLIKQGLFAFFRTPPGMVVLGVIIMIFLILSIFMQAGAEEEAEASENSPAEVEVTKVGDEAVGNNETITYTLTINPTGSPTDIRVIDELPENADFVSANPCPNVETETRIEWLLSSLGNCGSDQPNTPSSPQRPSARGTIHNLGIAEINGSQMDALIRRINADSPLIGQGATIVQYADEFNVDPLLFFISINESQLCADDGVVSPGGSDPPDPDNYNCAGITWAAVDGVNGDGVLSREELNRWSAREGPYANDRPFTFVPTPEDGIGLFFNYVGVHPRYKDRTPQQFYDIYNPCADSNQYGYACGAEEMDNILARVRNALQAEGVSASSVQAAATFSPVTIQVILRPKDKDTYIDNQAFAEVIE